MDDTHMPTLNEAITYIHQMDLSSVISRTAKLVTWDEKSANEAGKQYKNYLILIKKYSGNHELSPSKDIDEIWHNHILYTQQYCQDCTAIFGHYLHHEPHDASKRKAIRQAGKSPFDVTQALYHQEFGEYIYHVRLPLYLQIIRVPIRLIWSIIQNRVMFHKKSHAPAG